MTKAQQEVINLIGSAYEQASQGMLLFPEDKKQALAHESGDTLADFIFIEVAEVTEGLEDRVQVEDAALRALTRAREDIQACIDVLEGA